MAFSEINFYNYRNIRDGKVELFGKNVFLYGKNGQGKTNFLDSIYLLSYGSSFKNPSLFNVINDQKKEMSIYGSSSNSFGKHSIHLSLRGKNKQYRINQKEIRDRFDILDWFPCIVFCHDDLFFVKGTPDRKRLFLDQTLSLYDKEYIHLFRRYKRILKNRNIVLKDKNTSLLDVLDTQLVDTGLQIMSNRRTAIESFNSFFDSTYQFISGINESLTIEYKPSWKLTDSDDLMRYLYERRERDLVYGTTTSGPHRDSFSYMMNNIDYVETASTGQLRLISLVLKVSQSLFYSSRQVNKPVFLFDDVFLELDENKRKLFLESIPENEQSFYTFLSRENSIMYQTDDSQWLEVNDGKIQNT